MQTIGHVIVNNETIKVLVRTNFKKGGGYISIKKRTSGNLGVFLEGESRFLSDDLDLLEDLRNGKVLKL
jgi:hypothetical protein